MKKNLLPLILGSFMFLLFGFQSSMAQEKKTSKVHIIITEDDEVTSDTTFELAEGQDPEMIKKVVAHMAGGDIHGKHMTHDVHVSHGGDHEMIFISSEDEGKETMEHKVVIFTDGDCEGKEKNIEVIVEGDEDMKWVEKGDGDEDVEVYVIKKGDGEDVKVVKKKIIVKIDEEEGEKVEETKEKKKKKKK